MFDTLRRGTPHGAARPGQSPKMNFGDTHPFLSPAADDGHAGFAETFASTNLRDMQALGEEVTQRAAGLTGAARAQKIPSPTRQPRSPPSFGAALSATELPPREGPNSFNGAGNQVGTQMTTEQLSASEFDEAIADLTIELDQDGAVGSLLAKHAVQLRQVFDHYAQGTGGGIKRKQLLFGSSSDRRGALRLTLDFDICPSFLTKREVKQIFHAMTRLSGTWSSGASHGFDWEWFQRFLCVLAIHALSKQPSFQHLYATHMAKVTVLLEMWGIGDAIKLQLIKHQGK